MSSQQVSRTNSTPAVPDELTTGQRIVLWMEVMENNEQLILNRLRDEVGPDGDVIAAYRRWYRQQMEEHDEGLFRMMERLDRCASNKERRNRIEEILKQATLWIPYLESHDKRVLHLRKLGFREFDAYHVASAESGACDRLVTCDDQFLKVGQRNAGRIKVLVADPISLVSEAGF